MRTEAQQAEQGPAAPRLLVAVSACIVPLGLVVMVWGAWTTGISFDEPYHVLRLRNYLEHGWYLLDDDLLGGQAGSWVPDTYVYAPVTALLLHGMNVLAANESVGAVSTSADAYAVRHLGVAMIGLLGVAATAALARLLFRRWDWALVAAATLLAVPMWTGHSMFNLKDVPTATGYTLVTLGLASLARRSPLAAQRRAMDALVMCVGIVLALGTRPGSWPGLVAATVLLGVLGRALPSGQPGLARWWRLVPMGLAWLTALVILAVIYPSAFLSSDWVLESALVSASYAGPGYWWYIPSQVVAGMPTLLLVVSVGGWLAGAATLRPGWTWRPHTWNLRLALVISQTFLMPMLAIARQSHFYDGLRQVLFALPTAVILLTWGVRAGVANAEGPSGNARAAWIVRVLACLAIAIPTLVQVRMFPYSYAYASLIVDGRRLDAPNDYWRTSVRELIPQIPQGEFVICSPETSLSGEYLRVSHEAGRSPVERSRDCRTDVISPILPFRRERVPGTEPVGETFLAVSSTREPPGANCTRLGIVTRPRNLTVQRMSAVYRCDLALEPYPSGGADFGPTRTNTQYLLGGWTAHPAEPGIWLLGDAGSAGSGSLGFALPQSMAAEAHVLSLEVEAPDGAAVLVNNRLVGRVRGARAVRSFPLTSAQVGRLGSRRLVVTIRAASGPQGVRLFGVGLSEPGGDQSQGGSG